MKTNTASNNNNAAASVEQTSGKLPHDERRRSNRVLANYLFLLLFCERRQIRARPRQRSDVEASFHWHSFRTFAGRRAAPMTLSNSFRLRASPWRRPSKLPYASPFRGNVKAKRRQSQIKKLYIVYAEAGPPSSSRKF